jgi:hypothetical protein
VPDGTTTAAELAERIAHTDNNLAQLKADIDRRRAKLSRLAKEVGEFVTEQQALAPANALIRDVDRRHGHARRPGAASNLLRSDRIAA